MEDALRFKCTILLVMISLVLITSCAKKSTAWKEDEVLSLLAQVPVTGNPIDMDLSDTHAFVALDQGGFAVLDLDTHESKWYTSLVTGDNSTVRFERIKNISVVPEYNRLFINEVGGTDGIKILDISEIDSLDVVLAILGGTQNIRHLEFKAMAEPFMTVTVEGLYSINSEVTMSSYDTENNMWMGSSSLFTSTATAQGIDFNKDYVYIAAQQRGLVIFDREANTTLSSFAVPGEAQRVKVQGNYAYLASRQSGLNIVDISNPSAPVLMSNFVTVGYATTIDVKDDLALISSGSGGIYLFDVSDKANPELLQRLTSCGYTNGAMFYGNNILVAGRDEGMLFYRIDR